MWLSIKRSIRRLVYPAGSGIGKGSIILHMTTKILDFKEACAISDKLTSEGRTVGLITGCFDIIHTDHIQLFRNAKTKVDVLFVGLDTDKTVKLTKGSKRPYFNISDRIKVVSELKSVDYVFELPYSFVIDKKNSDIYKKILKRLKPTKLVSNSLADSMFGKKAQLCAELGIELVDTLNIKVTSSTLIGGLLGL